MACDTRVRDWGKIRQSWYAMVGMKDEKIGGPGDRMQTVGVPEADIEALLGECRFFHVCAVPSLSSDKVRLRKIQ